MRLTPLLALPLLASVVAAQTIVESFDYVTGSNNLNGLSGGTGFSGAWSDASATDNLGITSGSLVPAATMRSGYVTAGNRLSSATGAATNLDFTATRELASSINLDASSTTYFSFLAYGDWNTLGNSRGFNVGFTGSATALSSNAVTVKKAFNTQNLVAAVAGADTGTALSNGIVDNQVTFIVAKLVTTNGADTLSIVSYANAETVAGAESWDSANIALGSLTGSLTHFAITGRINDSGMVYQFDQLRVGSTWDEVTAIPEPASLAALAGLAVLGIAHLRRRRC